MIHLAIDPGEAFGPVVTVAREQPHALALALDDQAIAVLFDFVKPVWPGRKPWFHGGGMHGSNATLWCGQDTSDGPEVRIAKKLSVCQLGNRFPRQSVLRSLSFIS